jgi:hypothetical protein
MMRVSSKPKCRFLIENPNLKRPKYWYCKMLKLEGPEHMCPVCILFQPEKREVREANA